MAENLSSDKIELASRQGHGKVYVDVTKYERNGFFGSLRGYFHDKVEKHYVKVFTRFLFPGIILLVIAWVIVALVLHIIYCRQCETCNQCEKCKDKWMCCPCCHGFAKCTENECNCKGKCEGCKKTWYGTCGLTASLAAMVIIAFLGSIGNTSDTVA